MIAYNKFIIYFILCGFFVFYDVGSSKAQNSNGIFNLEHKIKSSSEFIYIQSIEKDTIAGKESASEKLCLLIETTKSEFNNCDQNKNLFKFIIKSRGPKFMIIAYVNQKDLKKANQTDKPKVTKWVLAETINSENIKAKEENNLQKEKKPITETTKKQKEVIPDKPTITEKTDNNYKPEPQAKKNENITKHKKMNFNSESSEKTQPNLHISSSEILNEMAKFKTFSQIVPYLIKEKNEGKVVYTNRRDAFEDNIADCYIIVFDKNEKIKMILEKGNANRLNILNSKMVNENEIKNANKLYVYEF